VWVPPRTLERHRLCRKLREKWSISFCVPMSCALYGQEDDVQYCSAMKSYDTKQIRRLLRSELCAWCSHLQRPTHNLLTTLPRNALLESGAADAAACVCYSNEVQRHLPLLPLLLIQLLGSCCCLSSPIICQIKMASYKKDRSREGRYYYARHSSRRTVDTIQPGHGGEGGEARETSEREKV